MKVVKVVMENYGAFYGRHEFQVSDRRLVLILGENVDEPRMNSNGSAKSTLLESMDWCLYGVVPKEDHADSVINDETKSCWVTTYLEDDDGTPAEVTRSRPAALSFMVGGANMTCGAGDQELDSREVQARINQWLGMDRDVFHASVFFGQQDLKHFADATDGQRMEILSSIIPELGEVDKLLEAAKVHRVGMDAELAKARQRVEQKDVEIRALESMDYQSQVDEWERHRQTQLETYERAVVDFQAKYNALGDWSGTVATLEQQVAHLSAVQLPMAPTTVSGLDETRATLMVTNGRAEAARNDTQRVMGELAQIQRAGVGRCSSCGSTVTAEHLAGEVARLEVVKHQYSDVGMVAQGEAVTIEKQIEGLMAQLAVEVQAVQVQGQQHVQKLGAVNADLGQARVNARESASLAERIANGQATIEVKRAEVNPLKVQADQMQERLKRLQQSRKSDQSVVVGREQELALAQFWVDGFSARGLKSYILDSKLQEMTDAANEWVRLLTGGTFWVRFESQKKGRSTKALRNAPSIRVFKYQPDGRVTERGFRGWSGGERQRVSWCIDFGLSRLVARRATKRWDFLALDEVFKYVDQAGGEAVVEMLGQLQQEKSSIFVIEHDGEFQSHFETVVLVRKERSRSYIVEDSDGACEGQPAVQSGRVVKTRGKRNPKKRQLAEVTASVDQGVSEQKAGPKRTKARRRVSRCPAVRRKDSG